MEMIITIHFPFYFFIQLQKHGPIIIPCHVNIYRRLKICKIYINRLGQLQDHLQWMKVMKHFILLKAG